MKTRNILALILSILMIVSMLPASVFALPSAVTVSDSDYQHTDTPTHRKTALQPFRKQA